MLQLALALLLLEWLSLITAWVAWYLDVYHGLGHMPTIGGLIFLVALGVAAFLSVACVLLFLFLPRKYLRFRARVTGLILAALPASSVLYYWW